MVQWKLEKYCLWVWSKLNTDSSLHPLLFPLGFLRKRVYPWTVILYLALLLSGVAAPPGLGTVLLNLTGRALGGRRVEERNPKSGATWRSSGWVYALSILPLMGSQCPPRLRSKLRKREWRLTHSLPGLFEAIFHLLEFIPIWNHWRHA